MNKIFYKCTKVSLTKINKPILFYHVPKCAGTTFSVLLSWLMNPQTRIKGPLFQNNDKGGETAFSLFNGCDDYNFYNRFNFIYGHLPFEINKLLKKKFITISLLRNPVDRAISHYNWMLKRKYCSKSDDIQTLFNDNKITKNTITNQFSGMGINRPDHDNSLSLAYENLKNNINLLYKVENVLDLLKYLISSYHLPNLLFQNQQEMNYDTTPFNKKIIEIFIKNNTADIELYNMLSKNKIFTQLLMPANNIIEGDYFFSSTNIKFSNKNNIIIGDDKLSLIESELIKNKYKINLT